MGYDYGFQLSSQRSTKRKKGGGQNFPASVCEINFSFSDTWDMLAFNTSCDQEGFMSSGMTSSRARSTVRLQHHDLLPRLLHKPLKLIFLLPLLPLNGLFSTQSDPLRLKSNHGTPLLKNLQQVSFNFWIQPMPYTGPCMNWPWSPLQAHAWASHTPHNRKWASTAGLRPWLFFAWYSLPWSHMWLPNFLQVSAQRSSSMRPALTTVHNKPSS